MSITVDRGERCAGGGESSRHDERGHREGDYAAARPTSTGSPLTYAIVAGPAHGTLSGNRAGTAPTRRPPTYNGADSFTFKANDGALDSNLATVSITVVAVDDAPVAANDSYATNEDTALTVAAPGVLANDTDIDSPTLTAVVVAAPAHGTVALAANGGFTYTPAANYSGADSFTYKANDGTLNSNLATVALTVVAVNQAPVAANQTITTAEDTAAQIVLAATDREGSPLTYTIVAAPAHGTLSGAAPTVTYTPVANYNGSDSFTFKANDGALDSNIATVSLTITAVNDAPVATNDSYSTNEDTPLTIAAPGVLANDTDIDSPTLTAVLVTAPAHGTVALTANGSFTYTPAANYNGADSFTYKANDGSLDSNVATVSIAIAAVNDAPVAANDSYATNEDAALTVAAPGVLANDTDIDSPTLTAVVVTAPAHGTLALAANGGFTYTPIANYSGPDSFTYKANDGTLNSNLATVALTVVAVNQAPVAANQTITTAEDTAAQIVLAATDREGSPLTYTVVTGPAHGTVSGTAPTVHVHPRRQLQRQRQLHLSRPTTARSTRTSPPCR